MIKQKGHRLEKKLAEIRLDISYIQYLPGF